MKCPHCDGEIPAPTTCETPKMPVMWSPVDDRLQQEAEQPPSPADVDFAFVPAPMRW